MTFANQYAYDNATEPELSDYREEPMFAQFAEYVVLELASYRDCMGIDSQIFLNDLELAGGGYQLAFEWVCERATERQYLEFKEDQSVKETT